MGEEMEGPKEVADRVMDIVVGIADRRSIV